MLPKCFSGLSSLETSKVEYLKANNVCEFSHESMLAFLKINYVDLFVFSINFYHMSSFINV